MNIACVAFAFGTPSSTSANQRIAQMALGLDIPSYPGIYTQRDVNIAFLQNAGFITIQKYGSIYHKLF